MFSKQALVLFYLTSMAGSMAIQADQEDSGTPMNVRALLNATNRNTADKGRTAHPLFERRLSKGSSSSSNSKSSKSSKSLQANERGVEFSCEEQASHPLCGRLPITDDLDLDSDVNCLAGSDGGGEFIVVDGATLDCKGNSITGPVQGAQNMGTFTIPAGVLLKNGGALVNCNLSGFITCVFVSTVDAPPLMVSSMLDNVFMSECRVGLFVLGETVEVTNSATVNNNVGVQLSGLVSIGLDGLTSCENEGGDILGTDPNDDDITISSTSRGIVCDEFTTDPQASLCSSASGDPAEITPCGCPVE